MMYTSHGHPIPGSENAITENPPEETARCGGPALCSKCSHDQSAYLHGALTPKPHPAVAKVTMVEDEYGIKPVSVEDEIAKPKPTRPELKSDIPALETQTFQRKPFQVEALQVTDENFEAVAAWCGGSIVTVQDTTPQPLDVSASASKRFIQVNVARPLSRRQTEAYVGDWILYASKGYKVYADRPFRKNFDKSTEVLQELFVTDEVAHAPVIEA